MNLHPAASNRGAKQAEEQVFQNEGGLQHHGAADHPSAAVPRVTPGENYYCLKQLECSTLYDTPQ